MSRLRFYFFLFITVLFFTACSNDDDDTLNISNNQITNDDKVKLRSSIVNGQDRALLQSFYQDVLSLQTRSGFYNELYNLYGYFDWPNYQSYVNPDGDPILVMPVVKSHILPSTGIMVYHKIAPIKK